MSPFSLIKKETNATSHVTALAPRQVRDAIFVTFQESQNTEKLLSTVVALKDEAHGDKGNIY